MPLPHRDALPSVPWWASAALLMANMCAAQAPETGGRMLRNSFLPQLTAIAGKCGRGATQACNAAVWR
jgi:hypothetical protein